MIAVPAVESVLGKAFVSQRRHDTLSNNSYAVAQSMTMFRPPAPPPTEMKTFKSGRRGADRPDTQARAERGMWFGFGGFLFDCVDQSPPLTPFFDPRKVPRSPRGWPRRQTHNLHRPDRVRAHITLSCAGVGGGCLGRTWSRYFGRENLGVKVWHAPANTHAAFSANFVN
jgi:hypothetical protein